MLSLFEKFKYFKWLSGHSGDLPTFLALWANIQASQNFEQKRAAAQQLVNLLFDAFKDFPATAMQMSVGEGQTFGVVEYNANIQALSLDGDTMSMIIKIIEELLPFFLKIMGL